MSAREEFERQLKAVTELQFFSALKGIKEEDFPYFCYARKMIQDEKSTIAFLDEDRYTFGTHRVLIKNDKYPFQLKIEYNLTICHLGIIGVKKEKKVFQLETYTKHAYEYFLDILQQKKEHIIGGQVLLSTKDALETIIDFMERHNE